MWNRLGSAALAAAVLAGTPLIAQAQPKHTPVAVTDPDTSATVFHGPPSAAEFPGYGSSTSPGYPSSAGGTTVFHGAPAGLAEPLGVPPPPRMVPPPAPGSGR